MGDFAESVPMTHQARVRLWSSLDGARLSAARSVWYQIEGDDAQKFFKKLGALFLGTGLEQSFTIAAGDGQAACKTDSVQLDVMPSGRLEHQSTDQIMDEEVEPYFPLEIFRILAAQVIHLECDLEVAQGQFHGPAASVEPAQSGRRELVAIQQRGSEDDSAGTKSRNLQDTPHQAQRELIGHLLPFPPSDGPGTLFGF